MYYIIIIFVFACLFTIAIASRSLAPFVPTFKKDLPRIFKLANLKPGEIFYDLGCGTGRVSCYISKHASALVVGIEFAPPMYLICLIRLLFNNQGNLTFKLKSLYQENLKPANVVYVFGMENKMKNKFPEKLTRELRPGTRVISYCFEIDGWQPKLVDRPSKKNLPIYLYVI